MKKNDINLSVTIIVILSLLLINCSFISAKGSNQEKIQKEKNYNPTLNKGINLKRIHLQNQNKKKIDGLKHNEGQLKKIITPDVNYSIRHIKSISQTIAEESPSQTIIEESPDFVYGGYKTCIVSRYSFYNGNLKKNSKIIISNSIYNQNGKKIKESIRKVSNAGLYAYNYDSIGRKIDKTNCVLDPRKILTKGNKLKVNKKHIYKYDTNGNMIEELICNSKSKIIEKNTNTYNTIGNLIEEVIYNSKGIILGKHNYKYDTNGNMIEKVVYNSKSKIIEKHTCTYNTNGNLIEEVIYNSKSIIIGKHNYKYDIYANLMEKITYNKFNKPINKIVYEYSL